MKFFQHLRVAKIILWTDFKTFKLLIVDKIIDMMIWVSLDLWVSGYILPKLGIQSDYGLFMLGAVIATVGTYETWPIIFSLTSDFENTRVTHYYATLPLPSWMMLARMIVYYASICAFLALMVLPLAFLVLWDVSQFWKINWFQFGLIFIVGNIFYGAFAVFVTSLIDREEQVQHMWMRLIFPLWFLGGYQFDWESLHATARIVSYLNLLNPILHITEAYRAAILNSDGLVSFWMSVSFVIVVSFAISWIAIVRLKRKLDFV